MSDLTVGSDGRGEADLRTPRSVVGVFAHPDDEVFCAGGTMAKWATEGAAVAVVCATRGEAGQIRDSTTAVRCTLGQVREAELRQACAGLGVEQVFVLDYHDGTLQNVDLQELAAAIERVLIELDPDIVITFAEDGAYGHPDHIAVGAATALAVGQLHRADTGSGTARPQLLRSHFPTSRLSLAERLAGWLVAMVERFDGSPDYGRALTLFAEESTTMRFASDDVEIVWYPHGSVIVEQGEPATSLCLILSGSVDVFEEDGESRQFLRSLTEGEFFGELGVASQRPRSASVVATGNVTCLVLSPSKATKYDGRGVGSRQFSEVDLEHDDVAVGTLRIDVSAYVDKKLAALAAHRSQYPIDVDAFPRPMLEEMFGVEYFVPMDVEGRAHGGA
jgi:LmbE family N-acetylglucosaminyl deacetylase